MATRKVSSRGGSTGRSRASSSKSTTSRAAKPKPPSRKPSAAPRASSAPSERRAARPEALHLRELSVGLTVDDLERSLAFYTEALGFSVKERWERDGKLAGVMLVAGACELALGQDDWGKGRDREKGIGFRIYATSAQDLAALAARLRAHGYEADGPIRASWGADIVSVSDPDGFQLSIYRENPT